MAARGKEVVLRGREETLVRPGQAPGPPRPAATSLLLHVRWPPKRALNHREITVAGRTDAGALVFVAGRPVRVDARGRFRARVRLRRAPTGSTSPPGTSPATAAAPGAPTWWWTPGGPRPASTPRGCGASRGLWGDPGGGATSPARWVFPAKVLTLTGG